MAPWLLVVALIAKIAAVVGAFGGAPDWFWVAGIFGPDLYVLYALFWPEAGAVCPVVRETRPRGPEVWLTIDDGPDPVDTPRNLALLARHGAKATFFLVGERAAAHPDLVREIVRQGHEVAHHTQTHPLGSFWCAGRRRLERELDLPLATFRELGIRPRWFRPPVGIKNLFLARALAERGLRCVAWTIRSYDSLARSASEVVARVGPRLRPGAIVLLHEGPRLAPAVRESALEAVLELIAARGYRCALPGPAVPAGRPGVARSPALAAPCSASPAR